MNKKKIASELLRVARDLVSYDDVDLRSDINRSKKKIQQLQQSKNEIENAWRSRDYDILELEGVLDRRLRREIEMLDDSDPSGESSEDLIEILVDDIEERLRSLDMLIGHELKHLNALKRVKIS